MQKGSLPFAIREQSFHPDLRIRRYQPAERSHVKQFPSRSFGLAITILSVSHLLHNTTSHTRILGRRQFLTRHHTHLPTCCQGKQRGCVAACWTSPWPIPWCRNLACNTVMRRSRPDLRSPLWMVIQCLSFARLLCGSLRIECRHLADVLSFLHDLALPESRGCD
jgi:hypothetical protein